MVAAAPSQSARPRRLPETRAASGRASSSPAGMMAWTRDSEPISSAVASNANPASCVPMPASQAGCCTRWTRSVGFRLRSAGAARAWVCMSTEEAPNSAAATRASTTTTAAV